jgi:hypothetical protein
MADTYAVGWPAEPTDPASSPGRLITSPRPRTATLSAAAFGFGWQGGGGGSARAASHAYHRRNGDCQDRAEPGNPGLLHLISLHDLCSIFFCQPLWWTRLRVRSATAPAARAMVTASIAYGRLRLCPDQQDPAIGPFIPKRAYATRYRSALSGPAGKAQMYLEAVKFS